MLREYFLRLLRTKSPLFCAEEGAQRGKEGIEREWKGQAESLEAEGDGEEGDGGAREDYGTHYNGWTWTTGNDNG